MPKKKNRNEEICKRFLACKTCVELAEAFGISRARVGQILKNNGINYYQGGQVKRGEVRRQTYYDGVNQRCFDRYGISIEEKRRLAKLYSIGTRSPTTIYSRFLLEKKRRNYTVKLTFKQWWKIWQDSGHWKDYGRFKGCYCMALKKGYSNFTKANVHIIPFTRWRAK